MSLAFITSWVGDAGAGERKIQGLPPVPERGGRHPLAPLPISSRLDGPTLNACWISSIDPFFLEEDLFDESRYIPRLPQADFGVELELQLVDASSMALSGAIV